MKNLMKRLLSSVFSLLLLAGAVAAQNQGGNPADCSVVYVDSGNAIEGGFLIKVDPVTKEKSIICSGHWLDLPFGVVLDPSGCLVVSGGGRLVRIDPATGHFRVLTDGSNGLLGYPLGMAVDRHGNIYVANTQAIVRVDWETGAISVVSSGGTFHAPLGVAVAPNGHLVVLNMAFPAEIVEVNPHTGAQTVISSGGLLNRPQGIAVDRDFAYVTDVATADGNFGIGRVIRIDLSSGEQKELSVSEHLVGPVGITIDCDGFLIVGDPYTINPNSRDPFDGGIIRIDPANGAQTLITRGAEGYVNPRGVVIVPQTSPISTAKKGR